VDPGVEVRALNNSIDVGPNPQEK
jgi:hypothetical protein